MVNETQVGQLVIDLKIKIEALEKGLETAKKKLEEIEKQNQQVQSSNKQVDASFIAMAVSVVASLGKISSVIKGATEEYKEYTQAMSSLQNVSEYTGESMSDFSNIMDKFGKYMTKSDMATTIKNFSLMGMTAEQTEKMMEALTNSAIRNRNANYTVSEAVKVASDGYKQGLSTLSDSAGVTENLSVQLDIYAKSIGKTASQLTEAEKNQAYLVRTMAAAEPFASAMADYTETLAGKQGEYSQALRETQVAYAEALEPTLIKMEEMKATAIKTLGSLISEHGTATTGVTTFTVALLGLGTAFTVGVKGVQMYKTAIDALNISSKALKSTMTGMLVFSAVIAGYTALTTAIKENEEAQRKLNEITETYKQIQEGTYEYTDKNISGMEQRKQDIEEQIELLDKKAQLEQEMQRISNEKEQYSGMGKNSNYKKWKELDNEWQQLYKDLKDLDKQFEKSQETNGNYGESLSELNEKLEETKRYLNKTDTQKNISNLIDTETIKNKKKEASTAVETAKSYQQLFKTYQEGKKGTTEYENAVAELEKKFPEAVNANGIMAEEMKILIDSMAQDAGIAWNDTQATIQDRINKITDAIANCNPEIDVNGTYAKSVAERIKVPTEEVIPTLQTALNLFNMLLDKDSTQVGGGKSTYTPPKTSKSSSYSNKALDNYKKEIEYKKSLDQISLQEEINMYQTALKKYAKTVDEKRELTTKIYELTKELAQKEKEVLDQQTKEYERYIEDQKNLRGAEYAVNERASDLDKIISMHQNYLNQILHDERLSLEERKEIYEEELDIIRDYEQQKRDLRIENIDNTVSQLTSAITKQIEEMQEADEEAINKNIELVEKWKDTRIDAINEEYNARIKAIQDELDALDKAEEQKTRDEEDSEYEKKKLRLEQLIAYEHDATTKVNYEKELAKLVEDHNKTLDKRVLDDKKQALKDQKDILKDEQSAKIDAITQEAERQREQLQTQLDNIKRYYDKQKEMAQENAQAMLLNVEQNQNEILNLLQTYGDGYEITGQTFGEKLGQGFAETAMQKIQSAISAIQVTIDSAIESNIARLTSLNTKISSGSGVAGNTVINKTVNVEQNNTITSPVDSPSVAWKKQETLNRNLANSLSYIF